MTVAAPAHYLVATIHSQCLWEQREDGIGRDYLRTPNMYVQRMHRTQSLEPAPITRPPTTALLGEMGLIVQLQLVSAIGVEV